MTRDRHKETLPIGEGAPLRRRRCGGVIALCALAFLGMVAAWIAALGPLPLGEREFSGQVVDRDGRLLRPFATSEGRWRFPARADGVDPRFVEVLLAYEDKRYWRHYGVDPLALMRAAAQFVSHGRIVSGASTITMQVARLIEPRHERTIIAKFRQIVRAIELEYVLSKNDILALYFDLAPYGGNLEGVRAAALAYFGKEPRRLSLGEAALLAALPQSPEARRPDRATSAAGRARDRVLDRLAAQGVLAEADVMRAKAEAVPTARKAMPMLAPHATVAAMADASGAKLNRLTIDGAWQKSLEDLAHDRAHALGTDISVAIVAVDHASGEVLAHIGSADYFDDRRAGQVDMTRALRSPGSTLKPFIYGLGFEDGIIHPETIIDDRPVRYAGYGPENFDLTFQGAISVRRALQRSLNVPAIAVLDKVGPSRLATRLAQAGATLTLPRGEAPGLALGLGGVGITLTDLVKLYAGLARGGSTVALTERQSASAEAPAVRRLLDPVAAWYVGNVLLGTPPPDNAAGGRIAFKTGTSYGYRDAWAVGFDGKRTIGVWVGRPDGAPAPGLIGRTAAAPILFDAFARAGRPIAPLAKAPRNAIFATNAKLPPPLQHFGAATVAAANAEPPLRILYPPHGARLELAAADGKIDPIALKLAGGVQPLTVLVNGVPMAPGNDQRTLFFTPDGPGFVRLTVMDARGAADSVVVRLQ